MIPVRCTAATRLLAILDVSWWTHMAFAIAGGEAESAAGMPAILCGWIARLLSGTAPGHLVAALDSRGPTWRHAMMSERQALASERGEGSRPYKYGRKAMPDEYWREVSRFEAILSEHGVPCYRAEGWEADDVAATVTRQALRVGLDVVLITLDKDWRAEVRWSQAGPEVYCWSYGRKEPVEIGPTEVLADIGLGVSPELVPHLLALAGDASDGVPGVPGLGPVRARQALARWGTVGGILAAPEVDIAALEAAHADATKARDKAKRALAKARASGWDVLVSSATEASVGADLALGTASRLLRDERVRRLIAEHRADAELGLALTMLDTCAPGVVLDIEAARVGGFDIPALKRRYLGLGFSALAAAVAQSDKG